ncbi:MAG: sigma-70 family RNA polymerase sigma factor [Lawsonella sp.]
MSDVMDEAWFRDVYQQSYRPIASYLQRRLPKGSVNDMLSVVMTRTWENREQIPEHLQDKPLPWIYGVARTAVGEYEMLRQHQQEEEIRRNNPHAWEATTTEIAIAKEGVDPVKRALSVMTEPDRELLTLSAWEGFSTVQIAKILNISPTQVRVKLHRARGRLATLVEAFDVDTLEGEGDF